MTVRNPIFDDIKIYLTISFHYMTNSYHEQTKLLSALSLRLPTAPTRRPLPLLPNRAGPSRKLDSGHAEI